MRRLTLTRENFFIALELQLGAASESAPLSLILARVSPPADGSVIELRAATSTALVDLLGPGQFLGYVGGGVFAVALPDTEAPDGQAVWEEILRALSDVARPRNATVDETYVTSIPGETVASLYGRCAYSIRPLDVDAIESGALHARA